MLHLHSKDRISGTSNNFDISVGDNPRLHNIKAISLESVEMVNSVYNIPSTWNFKTAFVKHPSQDTFIINGKNTIHFTYQRSSSHPIIPLTASIIGNQSYSRTAFENALRATMTNALTSNGIIDTLDVFAGFTSYEIVVVVTFETARINIVATPGSLSDYFTNIQNDEDSSFKFPKARVFWSLPATPFEDWKSIQNDYPNGIYIYEASPTPGNYNAGSLVQSLNTSFQATSTAYNLPSNSLQLTASETTFKTSLYFEPSFLEGASGWRMYTSSSSRGVKEMGFTQAQYEMPLTGSITGSGLINVNSHEIVYLHCPTLPPMSILSHNGGITDSTIAKIHLGAVPIGHTFYYKNGSDSLMTFENSYSDITVLNFFLTDENLEPIDLNGVDWSMTFIIYT